MQANNTPVDAPDIGTPEAISAAPSHTPLTPSILEGLKTKALALIAAAGLVAAPEKVEGATTIAISGLPNGATYTMSEPTLHGGGMALNTPSTLIQLSNLESSMYDDTPRVSDTSTDRITLNLAGITAGTLTITGTIYARTGDPSNSSNGLGFANTPFTITQELRFGKEGQASTLLNSLTSVGSGKGANNATSDFNNTEEWFASSGVQSYTVPISGDGTYNLDNVMIRTNTSGSAMLNNFSMHFSPIPEPSTGLMAGGAMAAALLRRRREKDTQEQSE